MGAIERRKVAKRNTLIGRLTRYLGEQIGSSSFQATKHLKTELQSIKNDHGDSIERVAKDYKLLERQAERDVETAARDFDLLNGNLVAAAKPVAFSDFDDNEKGILVTALPPVYTQACEIGSSEIVPEDLVRADGVRHASDE